MKLVNTINSDCSATVSQLTRYEVINREGRRKG